MHVAKLHAALHAIAEEFDSGQTLQNLDQLESTLAGSVASPGEETTLAFRQAYEKIEQILQSAPTNSATPTRRMIFGNIGATQYIGQGLWTQLSSIITENSIALANAVQQISELNQKVQDFYDSVRTLHDKLHDFDIEPDSLPPRQARVAIAIPPELVGSSLDGLATEIHEFDDVLKTFQKVAGTESVSLKISSICPSGFQLFLDAAPVLAAVVATAIQQIADIHRNLLATKKLIQDLAKQNVPAERIQALKADEELLVDKGLDDLAKSLLADYCKSTGKARSDLKVLLARDLRFLAHRIDQGLLVEAQMSPPAASAKAPRKKLIQTINEHGRALADLQRPAGPIFSISLEDSALD